jgi:plasmid stabilization system protein ParE
VTPRFIVRPAAEADIAEAALWYEARSMGLGAEFLRAVDVCFEEIRRSPERFPQIYKGSRRALLRRFPYAAYFVSTATSIRVVACMHVKRDPRRWQRRIDR